ncbi:MAG TPA: tRNA guanosine(34) transglycosylase Tgt [Candidatus Paceibacterota bacterium]|nr:tRNA guanosine(34) transglycosylase Tgt [Candidatus Paceibacterota bacterium]
MFTFKILKQSKRSRARLGVIRTPHGEIETPAFVPVATRGTVRTLDSDEVANTGSQVLICNTFHLHIAPGEKVIKKAGGLHRYMHWGGPLMTDSGGFQVYSLGFGSDHGIGKVLKDEQEKILKEGSQPHAVKITDDGVFFRSPIDGTQLFFSPKESVRIQEALGADIIFAFDECPSPLADEAYMRTSLEKTHRWAAESLRARKNAGKQAMYGIVQGGVFASLRLESARVIGGMDFEGFGFGGEFGYDKRTMKKVIAQVTDELPAYKPRHILGIGHPEDFAIIASAGGDTFDCIAPTHYARRGIVFTSKGRIDVRRARYEKDVHVPLDRSCRCDVCKNYSRGYVASLIRAKELSGMKLATYHNLHYFNTLASTIRKRIKNGDL